MRTTTVRAQADTGDPIVSPWRDDFPILTQDVNGQPLVFLDSAASAQRPERVIDAMVHYERHDHANVHRGVHTLSQRATDDYEGARARVAGFVGADSASEIVFTRGTTEAINLVAHSFLGPTLASGDEIVVTELEHHANIVPWQLLAERSGAVLKVAPVDAAGVVDADALVALLGERTRLLAIAHVSNALGTVLPVAELTAAAHDRGIPVLVDGAQGVPHGDVDVRALGCDFYAFSAHKMYGPTGIGALWAKPELLEAMPPWQGGGEMIREVSFTATTYNDPPHRFEAGTPNIVGAVGFGAAVDYLRDIGMEALAAHEHRLLAYATERLGEVPGLAIVGQAPDKVSVLSFVMDGAHPHDIGTLLDQQGIAVRTGHHCAMPLMQRFGLPGTARASLGLYNDSADIDRLVDGLLTCHEMLT
ncbi:MAG: cysteine desulfurase [Pseudomonadota bacterium]